MDLGEVVDRLWRDGVGPDDRPRIRAILDELGAPGVTAAQAIAVAAAAGVTIEPPVVEPIANATDALRAELATFHALIDLMQGTPAPVPVLDGAPATRLLGAAAAVWSAAVARDPDRLDRGLGTLERHLGAVAADDARGPAARAWADLAVADAALVAADRSTARHRLEAVARGNAPVPLRVAATLRVVTLLLERADLDQARTRCRQAATLSDGAGRPMHAQHARIAGAMLDYVAGDAAAARRILRAESEKGPLGLLPRILLSSFEPPERAMPLLAEGLAEAGERGDPFAFTMCTLVGARRYANLDRDGDALLILTTAIHQLHDPAPAFAATLEDERTALRNAWGDDRYAAAERAAIELLGR